MVSNKGKKPDAEHIERGALAVSSIVLLGIGSLRYQQLKQNLFMAMRQLKIDLPIEEITQVDQLIDYDIGGIPALVVNGRVMFQRVVPSKDDIVDVLNVLLQADESRVDRILQQATLAEFNRKAGVMKKILMPTDFSQCALNALGYAVDIANQFGCKITLLHTYKHYSTSGMFVSVEEYMEKDAAKNLLNIIKKVEPKLRNGASIDSKLIQGDAIPVISEVADKSRYDLIIMGTKGASGLKEVFTGSITNGIIKSAQTPVLAVPDDFDYQPIDRMVLAVDDRGVSKQEAIQPLINLAKGFDAKIHVFHHASSVKKDKIDPAKDLLLGDLAPSVHYELNGEDPVESINQFVEETGAGLLVMIRHTRSFLEKVFHVSATSKTVFDSPVPLLILKD
jgi:nucleotide-binding universal stress UspA family protein